MSVDTKALAALVVEHSAMQKLDDLAGFLDLLVELGPSVLVEIGSGYGGTLHAWCAIVPQVIAIDVNTALIKGLHGATMLNMDSQDPDTTMVALLAELRGRPIYCLFVDGAHTYTCAVHDYETYRSLVRPGGLIAFHDIATFGLGDPPCEIPQLWTEIKDDSAREIICPQGGDWGGIGVLVA